MLGLFRKDKKRIRNFRRERQVEITTPLSIRLFVLVCAISIAATLVYAVSTQLALIQTYNYLELMLDGLAFFFLPILIALAISQEKPISRYLIACFCLILSYKIVIWPELTTSSVTRWLLSGAITTGSIWWIFFSKRIRIYYAVLTNSPLPSHLENNIESIMTTSPLEKIFRKSKTGKSPNLDSIVMITILVLFFVAIFFNESPTQIFSRLKP